MYVKASQLQRKPYHKRKMLSSSVVYPGLTTPKNSKLGKKSDSDLVLVSWNVIAAKRHSQSWKLFQVLMLLWIICISCISPSDVPHSLLKHAGTDKKNRSLFCVGSINTIHEYNKVRKHRVTGSPLESNSRNNNP